MKKLAKGILCLSALEKIFYTFFDMLFIRNLYYTYPLLSYAMMIIVLIAIFITLCPK